MLGVIEDKYGPPGFELDAGQIVNVLAYDAGTDEYYCEVMADGRIGLEDLIDFRGRILIDIEDKSGYIAVAHIKVRLFFAHAAGVQYANMLAGHERYWIPGERR